MHYSDLNSFVNGCVQQGKAAGSSVLSYEVTNCLSISPTSAPNPHLTPHFFFFHQGERGPMGRKGEVCQIRLCDIKYNPFGLVLKPVKL